MPGLTRVSSPEELGLSSGAVLRFLQSRGGAGLHALALARDGKVYALSVSPWRADAPHTTFSLSKSFASMAAGIAAGEGLLSYDDSVADVLPDCLPPGYDRRLHGVTLRHLLSMTSGLDENSGERALREKRDWAREILSFPVTREPGTHFHYNSHGTYLLGRMVTRRCGQSLRDYLMPRLFSPLGIPKPQWDCCPLGYNIGGTGLHLSCLALAHAAQLLLSDGVWEGRRLLPKEYLAQASGKQIDTFDPDASPHWPDWESGYGWQFWLGPKGRYRGGGMYGQVMMIDRDSNLALCVTAGLNREGTQMAALHELMDGLLTLPAGSAEEREELPRLAEPPPPDGGEPPFGEGSYEAQDGRLLRLETPDENTLRLFYQAPDMKAPLAFVLARPEAHRGAFRTPAAYERPQPTLGRFGVKDGELNAQILLPQSAFRFDFQIRPAPGGLSVRLRAVGADSGRFTFGRTERDVGGFHPPNPQARDFIP